MWKVMLGFADAWKANVTRLGPCLCVCALAGVVFSSLLTYKRRVPAALPRLVVAGMTQDMRNHMARRILCSLAALHLHDLRAVLHTACRSSDWGDCRASSRIIQSTSVCSES